MRYVRSCLFVSIIAMAAIAFLITLILPSIPVVNAIPFIIIAVIFYIVYLVVNQLQAHRLSQSVQNISTALTKDRRKSEIKATLEAAQTATSSKGIAAVRMCVFVYEKDKKGLVIYVKVKDEMFTDEEASLVFRKLEGLVGYIYWRRRRKPVWLNLANISPEELDKHWKMTSEQIKHTQHLQSLLAVPILSNRKNGKLAGVLSIDSVDPLPLSKLDSNEMQETAISIAELISKHLVR